jgi:hypothetical protein|tara:strand:- start:2377 stop:3600 length:1224 start_codon:yes stop_codon:yes gene_type:complete
MSINVTVTETPSVDLSISSSTGLNVGVGGTSHDSLVGIQGGDTGEYYHLTLGQYNQIGGDPDAFVNITGSETISGVKSFESGFIVNAGGQDIFVTGDLDGSERKLYIDADALIVGDNAVNSLNSAAILGSGNQIFGDYDIIAGGELNAISGDDYSVIIGGRSNLIELGGLGYNTINGGTSHSIKQSTASLVDGGYDNDILGASNAVIVGGQSSNITSGTIAPDHSIILGGENNNIQDASNAIVVGGANNFASGSFSTVMAGRGGRAIHQGSMVLADGKLGRIKTSFAEHGLTIDFASGVDVPTGNLAVAEDITMGGETVATRTWVQSQETSQRFDTVLPSGIDETGIEFSTAFSSAPMVQCELQLPSGGERTYFLAVRDITTTGFFVEFSDNIGTGYILQTRSIPNT